MKLARVPLVLLALSLTVALAACGGDDALSDEEYLPEDGRDR